MMAGSGYGVHIPRVGQGSSGQLHRWRPDRPIITGSVSTVKIRRLTKKQNSTKTGISTKLSGLANELYFDDKKDNELLYMHATKDFTKKSRTT
ncbi:hypothetical protein O9993_05795 [Vibrio lentus]|nr:hypothetical protein [Vibrio lentus]